MQLVSISIGDIVPLADRAKYLGALGSLWGISSVLGPLIGMSSLPTWALRIGFLGSKLTNPSNRWSVHGSRIMALVRKAL